MTFLENLKNTKGFMRGILIFFAALLTLGGPTYFMFILNEASLPRILTLAAGIITFIIGIILFSYILKNEQQSS